MNGHQSMKWESLHNIQISALGQKKYNPNLVIQLAR